MSVKHLRAAVAALALVTVAAMPAHADPWAYDASQTAASSPAHTGAGSPDAAARAAASAHPVADHALEARSQSLNHRYGLGGSSAKPLVVYEASSGGGFDWSSAGIGAAVTLLAAAAAVTTVKRQPAVSG